MDSCPNEADDWFLVPRDWVDRDYNQVEDAAGYTDSVRETNDGESAQNVTDAITGYNSSYLGTYMPMSADDLGEYLSLITLSYLFDEGSKYVYNEIEDINELSKTYKRQAKNHGDSYTTILSESIINTTYNIGEYSYQSLTINAETDLVGVIQKKCLTNLKIEKGTLLP
jgi:hypothetical protein